MGTPKNMPEEFLQFVWENKLFLNKNVRTVDGKDLTIISTGKRNTNSGPDFFNARIKIEDTEWAGNVEIHKKASDWFKHNHHSDNAYDNVILHVVEIHDEKIERKFCTPRTRRRETSAQCHLLLLLREKQRLAERRKPPGMFFLAPCSVTPDGSRRSARKKMALDFSW